MVSAAVPTHVPGQSFKGILCRIPARLVGSAGAAAPHLCSAPGLCWAREAVSELVVPAVVPLGWPVLPVVTSVDVQAFRDSLKHFCLWFFLARSWVLLSMWMQSLFIFKRVQKHEPAGFCSWYLWLLFRCSSISLHLCSLSCPKKFKVFLIDMHTAWSFSWTSVPDSLDENPWNRFLKIILTCVSLGVQTLLRWDAHLCYFCFTTGFWLVHSEGIWGEGAVSILLGGRLL